MIRFKCPACQTILKILDEGARSKISCPKCRQPMLVPAANPPLQAKPAANNPTTLGQLVSAPAPEPAQPHRAVADELVLLGLRKDADLLEMEPVVPSAQTMMGRLPKMHFRWLLYGLGFGLFAGFVFALVLVRIGSYAPSTLRTNLSQPEPATVEELVALLNSRGMELESSRLPEHAWILIYPTNFVSDRRYEGARQKAYAKWGNIRSLNDIEEQYIHMDDLTQGQGKIALCPTPRQARTAAQAGTFPNAFAWGCFVIDCNPDLSKEIRAKLHLAR